MEEKSFEGSIFGISLNPLDNLNNLENSLKDKIGINVHIKNKKNNSGSISFEYKDIDQLNRIIQVIKLNY